MRALVLACLALAGCAGTPPVSEQFAPASRASAELQTRRYEVRPEKMLPVALATLQDFGFQVTNSDAALGLIVAQRGHRKTFSEREFWQLFTFEWLRRPPSSTILFWPASLSAAVAVAPAGSGSEVRVLLHRFATKPGGEPIMLWAEEVAEPEVYAKFFDLLAQALAREAPLR
jgi:hypothetical protein